MRPSGCRKPGRRPSEWPVTAVVAGVALAYAAGSLAAFHWFNAMNLGATFFPPAGITLAALVVVGPRRWPAVLAAVLVTEFVLDVANGLPPAAAVGYGLANTVEPLAGALLLGAHRGRWPDLERSEDLLRFVGGPVLAATAVGAVIGATTDALFGEPGRWPEFFLRFWLGDGLGVLVVGGTLLALMSPGPAARLRRRAPEAVGLLLLTTGSAAAVLYWRAIPLGYVVALLFVWIAFRIGVPGVTLAGAGVAVVAGRAITNGEGLAADLGVSPGTSLIYVQALIAVLVVTTAALAVEIGERERTVLRAADAETERRAAEAVMEAERRAHRRSELLHRVTAALGTASTLDDVLVALHRAGLSPLGAAASSVGVRTGDGTVRTVATGFPDGTTTRHATLPADSPLPGPATVRDGEARFITGPADPPDRFPAGEVMAGTGLAAAAVLPLRRAGEPIGFVAAHFAGERDFGADDRSLLEAVAVQAENSLERVRLYELAVELATENARLYQVEHDIAEVLQRSLLPHELPEVPQLALASRYLAGAEGTQAGGDWYDVLVLDDERAAVVVGDVVGNGPGAAAVMAQLRSALVGALIDGRGPAAALEHLDRFAARIPGARGSTAACVLLDRRRGMLRWARAGHPPPLLVDGLATRFLDGSAGTVLGVPRRPAYTESEVPIRAGTTVLLYTDGLVERRGEVVDSGLDRLAACAADLTDTAPDPLLGALLDALLPAGRATDDIAMIAARVLPAPLHGRVPARPDRLRPLRRSVAEWSRALALPADLVDDLQLALGEAVSNAVEHAYRGGPGEVEYSIRRDPGDVVHVLVRDSGRWRPPPVDNHPRGRGLAMIGSLAADVVVDRGPAGTTVRFRLSPATVEGVTEIGAGSRGPAPRASPLREAAG